MRIEVEAREWNGKYHVSEEGGIQLGRNGGFHDDEESRLRRGRDA